MKLGKNIAFIVSKKIIRFSTELSSTIKKVIPLAFCLFLSPSSIFLELVSLTNVLDLENMILREFISVSL